jgi:LysM repeat protein
MALGLTLAVLILAAAVQAPTVRAQDQLVHVVQSGENLFRLALRYETTVQAIVEANGLANADSIHVGQRLTIPGTGSTTTNVGPAMTTGGTYVVQRGDTLSGIAFRYGISTWELMYANGLHGPHLIFTDQTLVIPGAGGAVPDPILETSDAYVVRAGDTLSRIAEQFNTTAFALAQSNGLADASRIRVGQVLHVPRAVSGLPGSSGGPKRILISLSEQHLYAFEGEETVYSFICSSGRAPYYTRAGDFRVQSKIPNAYGGAWDIWMPHWLGIYWAGGTENGIHALPIMQNGQTLWAGYLGSPVSYGCIVLGTAEAELLFSWAEIGTAVSIRH